MQNSLLISIWIIYFLVCFQADPSGDELKSRKKRKFKACSNDEVVIVENETTVVTRNETCSVENSRALHLRDALFSKFMAKTGETDWHAMYNYYVLNWPKRVPMKQDEWTEQTMIELEAALPSIKYKKKPDDLVRAHNPDLKINYVECVEFVYDELLKKINNQTSNRYSSIKWSEFLIYGWPKEVPRDKSRWNFKNAMTIYENFDLIEFVPKCQDESAFHLYLKIATKFEKITGERKSAIDNYKFHPWPKCVSQKPKYWDKQAMDEIQGNLSILEFIPKKDADPSFRGYETPYLKGQLFDLLLETINFALNTKRASIPWQLLNITNWPDEILKENYSWSRFDILRIFRALPKMTFTLKPGVEMKPKFSVKKIIKESNKLRFKLDPELSIKFNHQMDSKESGDDSNPQAGNKPSGIEQPEYTTSCFAPLI